jgi:hypothetical protein
MRLSKHFENLGWRGSALHGARLFESGLGAADAASRAAFKAIRRAQMTSAVTPAVAALHLSRRDYRGVRHTATDLLLTSVDTIFAGCRLAAIPYSMAAAALATPGGDITKLGRGAVAAALTAIYLPPFLLNTTVLLLGRKTPGQIGRSFPAATREVLLAASVQAAHDALAPVGKPIPRTVRKLLQGHFEANLLERARFVVSSSGPTIPELINAARLALTASDEVSAFTALNVIVLSDHPGSFRSSLPVWAYGLAHVELFERLGVDGWSERYARNPLELEGMAKAKADQVAVHTGVHEQTN